MIHILLNNYLLIINILIPITFGMFFLFNNRKYSLKEFLIQSSLTTIILIATFSVAYSTNDIYTKSYMSVKIEKFIYEEKWTEKVKYQESYKCGDITCFRTKTRYDNHPDRYFYVLKNDVFGKSISKEEYDIAKKEFKEVLTKRTHEDQSSVKDGRIYDVIPNKEIVHSFYDSQINYIYASKKNIIKSIEHENLESQFSSELVPYPDFFVDKYGNDNFSRIINSNLIKEETRNILQKELELLSIQVDANPILYFTTSPLRSFAYIIKGHYRDMHYNDAMLVVGVKENRIMWVESISLSKSAEYKVNSTYLKGSLEDLIPKFKEVLKRDWIKPNLEDYRYLAGDIDLPLWLEIIIVVFNMIASFLVFRYMFRNEL